jgi:hypothetical protein
MIREEQIERLVSEVVSRLAVRLGADGKQGLLAVVFTGATVGFRDALQQIRDLLLSGYRIEMAFSGAAEKLYGRWVREQLAGFPHIENTDPTKWLSILQEARAVVVPLLSVSSLSKLSLLIADNTATNLILHGLFMGKPSIIARNGVDPEGEGRKKLGFDHGTSALNRALANRLVTLSEFGCRLTDVSQLSEAVQSILAGTSPSRSFDAVDTLAGSRTEMTVRRKVVTAAHVAQAHRAGVNLRVAHNSLTTPLARELAWRCGVVLVKDGGEPQPDRKE